MNTLVVYYSKYGNTQKVAEIIASECASHGSARAINLDDLTLTDLKQADIVIMGSPTHRMNLPEAARYLGTALGVPSDLIQNALSPLPPPDQSQKEKKDAFTADPQTVPQA